MAQGLQSSGTGLAFPDDAIAPIVRIVRETVAINVVTQLYELTKTQYPCGFPGEMWQTLSANKKATHVVAFLLAKKVGTPKARG